ncbi:MAG: chromosome partitioning protein ParA [Mucilaginibacter polytrichastri]|nr:chromosome partitioning protein ParA [Mucilaginibacter polytrichastri]
MKCLFFLLAVLAAPFLAADAQTAVHISDQDPHHIFSYNEIEWLEDRSGNLGIDEISSTGQASLFHPGKSSTPQAVNPNSVYWYRIRITGNADTRQNWLLEFFDQTIDHLTAYAPRPGGGFTVTSLGDEQHFSSRPFQHKNFEIPIEGDGNGSQTYYFRIQSHERADVIIVLRSVPFFIGYALNEYFSFGIFYGMILVFAFYNLLMFAAIRQKHYLFYVWYLLSVAMYEMSTDGLAYQYLWPAHPGWNQYAFGVALFMISISSLLFTRQLLSLRSKAPLLDTLILGTIALRTAFFLLCFFVDKQFFNYKFVEFIPLLIAFFTGIFIWRKGYRPARFFVIGYGCLFLGFSLKILIMLHFSWINTSVITYYSLTIAFIAEMIFLSLAIGDKVRVLKKKKDRAQQRIIRQLEINQKLSRQLNEELQTQVNERTRKVTEQAQVIEQKNVALIEANARLQHQADEIARMNSLLEKDNEQLQSSVEKIARARALSADVDFEEFSRSYPDRETCFSFLSDLKWQHGYACRKCGETHYFNGHLPYSRRCSACGYEESVIAHTVFQNTRIPINKAFYMVFMIFNTGGKISSHKLSDLLGIRQSTCWAYSSRIKKLLIEKKKTRNTTGEQGWSRLVLENLQ